MRLGVVGLLLVVILALASEAQALRGYSAVYFLGASEFDTGNWLLDDDLKRFSNYAFSAPTPERGYWRGRWQSGRSSSDYLAGMLGHTAAASLAGGTNFAYGAGWLGPLPAEPAPVPGTIASFPMLYFSSQVTKLLAARNGALDPNALYVVAIGWNDRSALFNRINEAIPRAAMAVAGLQRLADHGATEFAVVLLDTLGVTDPARKAFSETYNAELSKGVKAIRGTNVTFVSRDGFVQSNVLHHGTFVGFVASLGLNPALASSCLATSVCRQAAIAAAMADQEFLGSAHLLFDGVHADTKYAEAFAAYMRQVLRLQSLPKRFSAMLGVLPDLNANGAADVVTFRAGAGAPMVAEIRDGADGALIRKLGFLNAEFTAADAAVLPDTDGDGTPELAVLALRSSDDRVVVQIRDVDGSGAARQLFFASGNTPVELAVIEDGATPDGIPALAVLSHRVSDGRVLVEVRHAIGAANAQTLWGPAGYFSRDLAIVPDANHDGFAEIAVLMSRLVDNRTLVQVRNATTGSIPQSVFFASGQTPVDLASIPDTNGDGVPEVAVLSSRDTDGRPMVEIRNAWGPVSEAKQLWLPPDHRAIALRAAAPTGADSIPAVAALTQRKSDGRIHLTVRQADGSGTPRSLWYTLDSIPRNLAMLADVDGNATEEGAVLMTRTSDGRTYVQRRNTSGAPAPATLWFSPR